MTYNMTFSILAAAYIGLTAQSFARSVDAFPTYEERIYDYDVDFDDFSQAAPPAPVTPPLIIPPATPPAQPAAPGGPPAPAAPVAPAVPSAPVTPMEPLPLPDPQAQEEEPVDDLSIGEIPLIETVELTEEMSRRAIDAFVLVREKYQDAELENYENLQDFVDQNTLGKAFEVDIKTFGFASVNDWNLAISTIGFAYNNSLDDQSDDIKLQVEEVKADKELAQDMKDRMIASLNAMIPSDNNAKIIDILLKDAAYAERLKLLENEGE